MYDDLIQVSASKWGVPVPWIEAVIQTESNWNPDATGAVGERGLMQISPATAILYGWPFSQMYDPRANIDAGTELLHDLRQSYGDDFRCGYSAYNRSNPAAWETNSQVAANVQRAMDNLAEFEGSGIQVASGGLLLAGAIAFMVWGKK